MSSKDYNSEMERQLEAAFISQDPDLLDVVFEIDGKKIYADKLRLSLNSSIFKSILSDSWNKIIEVKDFSFADFKEFLTFIHSGKCNITNQNIFVMVEIAEFYQSGHFKNFCNEYLSKMEVNMANVFQLLNTYNKYSMNHLKKPIHDFIIQNFDTFVKSKKFMNAERFVIKEVVTLKLNNVVKPNEVFQAVFQWSESRAQMKKQSYGQNFNMNDAIKAEIIEFLPFIEFKNMTPRFLTDFVVKRGFLFSYEKLSEILNRVHYVKVQVTNNLGQSIYGYLPNGCDAIEIIKSLNGLESEGRLIIHWYTNCKKSVTPNLLKKRDGVRWYLVYYGDGVIGVEHQYDVDCFDVLLAEMFPETNFEFSLKCKIEIE